MKKCKGGEMITYVELVGLCNSLSFKDRQSEFIPRMFV